VVLWFFWGYSLKGSGRDNGKNVEMKVSLGSHFGWRSIETKQVSIYPLVSCRQEWVSECLEHLPGLAE